MFVKVIKSVLSIAVVAAGASVLPVTSANAGSYGIYIESGNSGGYYNGRPRGDYSAPAPRSHQRGCAPRRALKKAWRMGLNRPHIKRIGHHRIAVVGYNRGHVAKVVFKKRSRHCRVLKTRGLR